MLDVAASSSILNSHVDKIMIRLMFFSPVERPGLQRAFFIHHLILLLRKPVRRFMIFTMSSTMPRCPPLDCRTNSECFPVGSLDVNRVADKQSRFSPFVSTVAARARLHWQSELPLNPYGASPSSRKSRSEGSPSRVRRRGRVTPGTARGRSQSGRRYSRTSAGDPLMRPATKYSVARWSVFPSGYGAARAIDRPRGTADPSTAKRSSEAPSPPGSHPSGAHHHQSQ